MKKKLKMRLYKVVGFFDKMTSDRKHRMFITAVSKRRAIEKFVSFKLNKDYCNEIECDFICNRDDIIPTVEPRKEKLC